MHAKQQIHIGILICTASLISYIEGASLSMLLPGSQRFSAIGQHSRWIDPIPSNLRQNNYSKRNGGVEPKPDQDVLDLENLKQVNDEREKKLTALEAQLEIEHNEQHGQEETPPADNFDKEPTDSDATIHATSNDDNTNDNLNINGNADGDRVHGPPPKQYHGAARLAFGQNPEIVSSTSTSTTTSTSTQLPALIAMTTMQSSSSSSPSSSQISNDHNTTNEHENTTPIEITNNGERRSGHKTGAKNGEYLFKHSGGQYSALDMAQYVFWTGDEEGVAKAVEEFIRKGLMSKESAIKFLRDISMGIDYLENAYSTNRQFDQLDDNTLRKEEEYQAKKFIDRTLNGHNDNTPRSDFVYDSNDLIEPVSTTSTTTTTAKPIIVVEKSVNPPFADLSLPLMQLNEIQNERNKEHSINFDEQSGRLRLADFLYAEYSLEEVIYQLAKVMFAQSLSKGSEETQMALQRLTTFLETEGASGRISPALQKKVLDVLLVALSDCLAENPQLISTARLGLGEATNPLPKLSDKH